jgi:hypothetical protein
LSLIEHDLIELELGEINDYFKELKGDEENSGQYALLPDYETIINESKKFGLGAVTDENIEQIMFNEGI